MHSYQRGKSQTGWKKLGLEDLLLLLPYLDVLHSVWKREVGGW